jgi:hypothetical protein
MTHAISVVFLFLLWLLIAFSKKNDRKGTNHRSNNDIINVDGEQVTGPPTKQALNITAITWNLAERTPTLNDCRFIRELSECSDIMAIGVQETEDIKPRRHEGRRSRAWNIIQKKLLGVKFKCITQHRMGGLQLAIFAKSNASALIEGHQVLDVACGLGNIVTNKGAICMILRMKGKSISFINAHLAAHQSKIKKRNEDYHRIVTQVIEKAQTKWLTPPHAESKRHLQRLEKDQRSSLTASLLSSSQPIIEQVPYRLAYMYLDLMDNN